MSRQEQQTTEQQNTVELDKIENFNDIYADTDREGQFANSIYNDDIAPLREYNDVPDEAEIRCNKIMMTAIGVMALFSLMFLAEGSSHYLEQDRRGWNEAREHDQYETYNNAGGDSSHQSNLRPYGSDMDESDNNFDPGLNVGDFASEEISDSGISEGKENGPINGVIQNDEPAKYDTSDAIYNINLKPYGFELTDKQNEGETEDTTTINEEVDSNKEESPYNQQGADIEKDREEDIQGIDKDTSGGNNQSINGGEGYSEEDNRDSEHDIDIIDNTDNSIGAGDADHVIGEENLEEQGNEAEIESVEKELETDEIMNSTGDPDDIDSFYDNDDYGMLNVHDEAGEQKGVFMFQPEGAGTNGGDEDADMKNDELDNSSQELDLAEEHHQEINNDTPNKSYDTEDNVDNYPGDYSQSEVKIGVEDDEGRDEVVGDTENQKEADIFLANRDKEAGQTDEIVGDNTQEEVGNLPVEGVGIEEKTHESSEAESEETKEQEFIDQENEHLYPDRNSPLNPYRPKDTSPANALPQPEKETETASETYGLPTGSNEYQQNNSVSNINNDSVESYSATDPNNPNTSNAQNQIADSAINGDEEVSGTSPDANSIMTNEEEEEDDFTPPPISIDPTLQYKFGGIEKNFVPGVDIPFFW